MNGQSRSFQASWLERYNGLVYFESETSSQNDILSINNMTDHVTSALIDKREGTS